MRRSAAPSRLQALLGMLALVAGILVWTPAPAQGAGPRIDMRLLLISPRGTEQSFIAWQSELDNEGIPYDTLIATTTRLTADVLQSGNQARYQGIVLATDDLVWFDGNSWISAFDSTEWSILRNFETTFGVRQVDTYTYPKPAIGLNWPTFGGYLTGVTGQVTAAGASVFPYLVGPVPSSNAWGYLTTPISTSFQTLVRFPTGAPLVGIYTAPDGREELVNTMEGAKWLLSTKLLLHGQIAWLTKGVYLGLSRNYSTLHIDDVFLANAMWDPVLHRTSTTTTARMTAADVTYARDWSIANSYRLDLGFNAQRASSTDPLTQAVLANKSRFGFWNHTWSHANLTSSTQDKIVDEIQRNVSWASANGITNFNPGDLVTGGHTGLQNPNMPGALQRGNIRYIGSDNLVNPSTYFLGPARVVPRYPTNIYWDTSTRLQNLDEYNWTLFYNCKAGCIPDALTWTQFVDQESDTWLAHAMGYDPRPMYVHQANLTNDRIVYDVLGELIRKYRAYVRPAFLQPTLAQSGQVFERMAAWKAAVLSGAVSAYIQDGRVYLSSQRTVDVPIAGTPVGDDYGGERSGWTTLQAGSALTLQALGTRTSGTPPVAAGQSVTTRQDTPVAIRLTATDAEADPLTYTVVSQPAHGALSGTAPALTYTPNPDYIGSDSFTFKADDGTFSSNTATVSISVRAAATTTRSVTLLPAADTLVGADQPDRNYGSYTRMIADNTPVRRAFVRFDLSSVPRTVTSATLRLHAWTGDYGSDIGGTVRSISNTTWTEDQVTWSSQPVIDGPVLGTIRAIRAGGWYALDVTAAVQGGAVSLAVTSLSGDGAYYDSRETLAGPQLVVTYTDESA